MVRIFLDQLSDCELLNWGSAVWSYSVMPLMKQHSVCNPPIHDFTADRKH